MDMAIWNTRHRWRNIRIQFAAVELLFGQQSVQQPVSLRKWLCISGCSPSRFQRSGSPAEPSAHATSVQLRHDGRWIQRSASSSGRQASQHGQQERASQDSVHQQRFHRAARLHPQRSSRHQIVQNQNTSVGHVVHFLSDDRTGRRRRRRRPFPRRIRAHQQKRQVATATTITTAITTTAAAASTTRTSFKELESTSWTGNFFLKKPIKIKSIESGVTANYKVVGTRHPGVPPKVVVLTRKKLEHWGCN